MKPFSGQATLHISGQKATVLLSLDMDSGDFEAELPNDVLPNQLLQQPEGEAKEVTLSNVQFYLPSGTLRADDLPEIMLSGNSSLTSSVNTSPLSLALNLCNDRTGTVKFYLSPKPVMIYFRHEPPLTNQCELYYLNNFIDHPMPMSVKHGDTSYTFQARKRSLSISSNVDIRPFAKRLGVAWAIYQGAHLMLAASYWDSTVALSVRQPRPYRRGQHFFRGWNNAQALLDRLVVTYLGMTDHEFDGWSKAIRFYLEGVNDDLDYDVRIVNFMVFIEMYDKSVTMSKQTIADTFSISTELADLVVRMRNKLIHEHMSMWRALPQVHAEILKYQQTWTCPEIDFTSRSYEMLAILFFLHLERIVNTFIAKTMQYTGRFNDCTVLIRSIEKKMTEQHDGVPRNKGTPV